jgi:hypothetical protein
VQQSQQQRRTVLSELPEAMRLPPGLNATLDDRPGACRGPRVVAVRYGWNGIEDSGELIEERLGHNPFRLASSGVRGRFGNGRAFAQSAVFVFPSNSPSG